jgi:hypothetical protein
MPGSIIPPPCGVAVISHENGEWLIATGDRVTAVVRLVEQHARMCPA